MMCNVPSNVQKYQVLPRLMQKEEQITNKLSVLDITITQI